MLAKPFVKWAGGKTQLLGQLRESLPVDFSERQGLVYVEPFVGGGAVLFWILQEYPNISKAVINDINPELICVYREIKSNVDALVQRLAIIQEEYVPLDEDGRKEYFLEKRRLFNSKWATSLETAALFIFLNRTCFNGLYRVNSKGEFNVPHGRYLNPRICDRDNLLACSKLLAKVEILNGDFAETESFAKPGYFFYLDPPYKPVTATSAFTSYSQGGFDDAEQLRLRDFCDRISAAGAGFMVSNSDPKSFNPEETFFDDIYSKFSIRRVSATRMINSNPNGRGAVSELVISNFNQL